MFNRGNLKCTNINTYLGNKVSTNIAFIASTMPLFWLNKNINKHSIKIIYLQDSSLFDATKEALQTHTDLIIKNSRESKLVTLEIIIRLIQTKISNNRIFFFHECCWPKLDLLIKIINPKADFYMQVTMNGLLDATKEEIYSKINNKKIVLFLLSFFCFKKEICDNCNDQRFNLLPYVKKYPINIKTHSIKESVVLKETNASIKNNKIIFFISTELTTNDYLISFYTDLINKLYDHGFNCYIKDHPRKNARLNMKIPGHAVELKSELPMEFLDLENFAYAIGIVSTSLVLFSGISISVIKLIDNYDPIQIKTRINHIESLLPNKVIYPNSFEELYRILI